jgi:peptidoglycan glycosyltransferase
MLNRAINQNYPAGSIFKIIDSAAALQIGIKPDDRIPAPNGYRPFDTKDTSACPAALNTACVENFGGETCDDGKTATLDFAFAKSCNTAFAQLAVERIGGTDLAEQANAFGFDLPYQGTRPPDFCSPSAMTIPLPVCRSSPGSQSDLEDLAALAQTAFGQRDVRITPIQAAMLSAAVANDGLLMKPYLVAKELRPNLDTLNTTSSTQLGQVIDPTLDQDLIRMMEDVVYSDEGTGGLARIPELEPEVRVAGKTGTADVGATSASNAEPDAWFTGFARLNGEPRIAVAVIIENGGVAGDESAGGLAAAPVAQKVMAAYLKTLSGVG